MKQNTHIFILCGGRGSRLKAKTNDLPKVLVPVNKEPMLKYIIDQFESQGFSEFTLGTGYLSKEVENYVNRKYSCLNISISNAGENAGMLKRIVYAKKHFGAPHDLVIVAYGDTFIDIDYRDLINSHIKSNVPMTLVTGKIQNPFGIVRIDNSGFIESFKEKPVFDYYIGCLVFQKSMLDFIAPNLIEEPDGSGLVNLFKFLSADKQLGAYQHKGLQLSFNTEPERIDVEAAIKKYHTLRENQ